GGLSLGARGVLPAPRPRAPTPPDGAVLLGRLGAPRAVGAAARSARRIAVDVRDPLGCDGGGSSGGSAARPPLPPGLPQVYRDALAVVLARGWGALHGRDDPPSWTVLHWAADEGRDDVWALLLEAGADPGHRDEMGKTALDYASARRRRAGQRPTLVSFCPQGTSEQDTC
ncbi:unnamed protein product, partial [Prorocentrum cordatum]